MQTRLILSTVPPGTAVPKMSPRHIRLLNFYMALIQLQTLIDMIFLKLSVRCGWPPKRWHHGHGRPPRSKAMAMAMAKHCRYKNMIMLKLQIPISTYTGGLTMMQWKYLVYLNFELAILLFFVYNAFCWADHKLICWLEAIPALQWFVVGPICKLMVCLKLPTQIRPLLFCFQ